MFPAQGRNSATTIDKICGIKVDIVMTREG